MFCTIKSESKHFNLKRIKFFLTWFKVPMKLIPINLKRSIAMIFYNKPAYIFFMVNFSSNLHYSSIVFFEVQLYSSCTFAYHLSFSLYYYEWSLIHTSCYFWLVFHILPVPSVRSLASLIKYIVFFSKLFITK